MHKEEFQMKVQSSVVLTKFIAVFLFIFLLSISKCFAQSSLDEPGHQLGDRLLFASIHADAASLKKEFVSSLLKSKSDLSVGSDSTSEPDILSIGWGGGGAFSSIVEYENDIYASSDVTGVWKYYGDSWQPFVKGLTNYNMNRPEFIGDQFV